MSVNGPVIPNHTQEAFGGIKSKINLIRQQFPSLSKQDCSLILHNFDNCVTSSVDCIAEGSYKSVLEGWNTQTRKTKTWQNNKKRNAKKNAKTTAAASDTIEPTASTSKTHAEKVSSKVTSTIPDVNSPTTSDSGIGHLDSDCSSRKSSLSINTQQNSIVTNHIEINTAKTKTNNDYQHVESDTNNNYIKRPISVTEVTKTTLVATKTTHDANIKINKAQINNSKHVKVHPKNHPNKDVLNRSVKDLHRTAVSLARFNLVLEEELETSEKSIKGTFERLSQALQERQNKMTEQLKLCKKESVEAFNQRQEAAAELKYRCGRTSSMSENDILNLRAEIKQFVGDRKVDETIATTKRFSCDENKTLDVINKIGQVVPLTASYCTTKPAVVQPVFSQSFLDKVTPPSISLDNDNKILTIANDASSVTDESSSSGQLDKQVETYHRFQKALATQGKIFKNKPPAAKPTQDSSQKGKKDHRSKANADEDNYKSTKEQTDGNVQTVQSKPRNNRSQRRRRDIKDSKEAASTNNGNSNVNVNKNNNTTASISSNGNDIVNRRNNKSPAYDNNVSVDKNNNKTASISSNDRVNKNSNNNNTTSIINNNNSNNNNNKQNKTKNDDKASEKQKPMPANQDGYRNNRKRNNRRKMPSKVDAAVPLAGNTSPQLDQKANSQPSNSQSEKAAKQNILTQRQQ